MKNYRTSEIAAMVGVHPNTVRFYEQQQLLPTVQRQTNGYRIYSERHLMQLQVIRRAFRAEILSGNLRKEVIHIVKVAAKEDFDTAIKKTQLYQKHLMEEIAKAHEAIQLTEQILNGDSPLLADEWVVGRREAAAQIGVSKDVLRDWERNGLIHIPQYKNRRQYSGIEMNKLKIIAILRNANYSQMAIRRMLQKLAQGETDLLSAIDTPEQEEDIISVTDRYITALTNALEDTKEMLGLLKRMAEK